MEVNVGFTLKGSRIPIESNVLRGSGIIENHIDSEKVVFKNIGRYKIQRFVDLMNKAPSNIIFQKDSPFCKNVHSQSLFIFRNERFLLIKSRETEFNKIHY